MSMPRIAVALVLALAVGFGAAWPLASAQIAPQKPAPKWEYQVTNNAQIEKMAAAGWELGWVTSVSDLGGGSNLMFTWKRAKSP